MTRFEFNATGMLVAQFLRMPQLLARHLAGAPIVVDGEPLDPAVQLMLSVGNRLGIFGLSTNSVAARRRSTRRSAALGMPKAKDVTAVDLRMDAGPTGMAARRYRPCSLEMKRAATIAYFHGGGWTVGDLDTHDALCRLIAVSSECNLVSVDYRLAPEHPFPAAVDDGVAAFRWVRDHPGSEDLLGAVAVMGDSAGGNLAAVVSMDTRDTGEIPPIAQGLIYPSTDMRIGTKSVRLFAEGFFLTLEEIEWFRSNYTPDPEQWTDPRVSPLLAADVEGTPPTWIWTAGFDPLRDEAVYYGDRLRDAGVDVHEHCFADQVHGFASMAILPGGLARTERIGRQMGDLIRRQLA